MHDSRNSKRKKKVLQQAKKKIKWLNCNATGAAAAYHSENSLHRNHRKRRHYSTFWRGLLLLLRDSRPKQLHFFFFSQ
jgi:hypothetical protein